MIGLEFGHLEECRQLFVKQLLWQRLVDDYLKPVEVDEIRKKDLSGEVQALLNVLSSFKRDGARVEKRLALARVSGNVALLQSRIRDLASALQQTSLARVASSGREEEVLRFALGSMKTPSRVKTPRTRSPRKPQTAASSEADPGAKLDLDAVKKDLNIFGIDRVVGALRSALEVEKSLLNEDVEYLREALESEIQFQKQAETFVVPSFDDLSRVERKLRKVTESQETHDLVDSLPSLDAPAGRHRRPPSASARGEAGALRPIRRRPLSSQAREDRRPSGRQAILRREKRTGGDSLQRGRTHKRRTGGKRPGIVPPLKPVRGLRGRRPGRAKKGSSGYFDS